MEGLRFVTLTIGLPYVVRSSNHEHVLYAYPTVPSIHAWQFEVPIDKNEGKRGQGYTLTTPTSQ